MKNAKNKISCQKNLKSVKILFSPKKADLPRLSTSQGCGRCEGQGLDILLGAKIVRR